jgi:NitT/TauT family transport system substrate-binding protein
MSTRRFRIMPLITSVIMAVAAGCGSAHEAASSAGQPDPGEADITVAALPAVDLAGLYIAQDNGLFAQQGLHVTIEQIASSQAIIADQLKGQVDISAGSYIA